MLNLPSLNADSPWRLTTLGLMVVLIVVAPFVLLRQATQRTLDATELVAQTREVEAAVHAVLYDLRDRELAAMALGNGIDSPLIIARIEASSRDIPIGMAKITRLTRGHPEQQVRIGMLQANISQRDVLVDRVLNAGRGASTHDDLVTLATRFPSRDIAVEIIEAERLLLEQRIVDAERLRQLSSVLTWVAMLAQLLLLGIVVYFSRRYLAQRQQAERIAAQANARAQSILQTVREPIVLADAQLRVVLHNTAFSELYDVDRDQLRGVPLAEIGDGAWSDAETLQRLGNVLARGRELWDYEQTQRMADGIDRTMLINARKMPLPDSDDHVVLITASDITAQKTAAQRIQELNRQLEGKVEQVSEVNRELEAYSYSVSHDLRAPLRHISGFADKLGRHLGERVDEKSLHYLDVIGNSAGRMAALIDDLLVYSRLGRSALRLQAVDMQSVVAQTRAMLDANVEAETPGRRIQWSIPFLPILIADENMMRQTWLNLLGNAVKYSAKRDAAEIHISHEVLAGGGHRFSVRDNGAGFDMAYATKLFGVFQRLHKATDYAGTGIGLATVRRVLLRHGGRIWAEAEPDRGATFHFDLPDALDQTSIGTPP